MRNERTADIEVSHVTLRLCSDYFLN